MAGLNEDLIKLKGAKILVTGASGLIGSAVVELLFNVRENNNYDSEIYAAGRNTEILKEKLGHLNNLKYYLYDAEKFDEKEIRFDYIIHCAAEAHPAFFSKYPVETSNIIYEGTGKILEYIKNISEGTRLLYVSSSEVYGDKDGCEPYTEDRFYSLDILNPRAAYPLAKRLAENMCASYKKEYGVDFVIVRPGHIYGPTMKETDSRASSEFLRRAICGENIIMKSPGLQKRSYLYAEDCASAILTVILKGCSGEAYNLASEESDATIVEFAKMAAKISNTRISYENPSDEEKSGYNLMDNSCLDASKLRKLGWEGKYDLESGIRECFKRMGKA